MSVRDIVAILAAALELWAIYSIINVGFVLLYRTTGVMNFAEGQLVMMGAFLVQSIGASLGYGAGVGLSVLVSFALGILIYLGTMRFLAGAAEFSKVIGTFMVAIICDQVTGIVWGPEFRPVRQPGDLSLHVGGGSLPLSTLVALAAVLVLTLVLAVALKMSRWGIEMRAVAENENLAAYRGIRVHWLSAVAWGVVFCTATLGAVIYVRHAVVSPQMSVVGFAAFPALVIGGIDSLGGTIVGSAILGVVSAVMSYYVDATVADAVAYALLLVVLFTLPYGLFGRAKEQRL